jgi:hypothetical protein
MEVARKKPAGEGGPWRLLDDAMVAKSEVLLALPG